MNRDILDVASRGMRPKWTRQTSLDDSEKLILRMATTVDELAYRQIYKLYGEYAWNLLDGLRTKGLMCHPGYNRWHITEKGRIAIALVTAKEPKP